MVEEETIARSIYWQIAQKVDAIALSLSVLFASLTTPVTRAML
jgi:hypothetical protein